MFERSQRAALGYGSLSVVAGTFPTLGTVLGAVTLPLPHVLGSWEVLSIAFPLWDGMEGW